MMQLNKQIIGNTYSLRCHYVYVINIYNVQLSATDKKG